MIDWFTVAAQIVNFLILVALLKYFLYGRILAAMEQRQKETVAHWDEAQQQREAAAKELDAAREQNRQLEERREQLLAVVHDDVEAKRQQLLSQVRGEVDQLHQRWSDAIQEETEAFLLDLRQRISDEVCAISRRVLADLASADLEDQMIDHFLESVRQLKEPERRAVISSLREGHNGAVVQTTYRLSSEQEERIRKVLCDNLSSDMEIQFETSADLLCGVALQTDAHKLAWDLRDYLTSLEEELRNTLDEETADRTVPSGATVGSEE